MYLIGLGRLGVLPATDKVCLWVEGRDEAVAVASEVVRHKVLIDLAGEAEDAVARPSTARVHVGNDKHP